MRWKMTIFLVVIFIVSYDNKIISAERKDYVNAYNEHNIMITDLSHQERYRLGMDIYEELKAKGFSRKVVITTLGDYMKAEENEQDTLRLNEIDPSGAWKESRIMIAIFDRLHETVTTVFFQEMVVIKGSKERLLSMEALGVPPSPK